MSGAANEVNQKSSWKPKYQQNTVNTTWLRKDCRVTCRVRLCTQGPAPALPITKDSAPSSAPLCFYPRTATGGGAGGAVELNGARAASALLPKAPEEPHLKRETFATLIPYANL